MTSLQKQLASIAASSSHELDLKAQKSAHSKSLLFEPKVAGGQSMDSVYQICLDGYEELCLLDNRFARYKSNVFGAQSVREDRMQMTKSDNNNLNVVIESFLGLVGSRLLLKPALKSVEWLVRRFRVHDYNTECLILTFLPYHNTQLFPTLLSILPKQLSPNFKFLHPYVSSLANPPRTVLVHAATNNIGFLGALNHYVLGVAKARHQYSVLLAFWASTLVQSIDSKLDSSLVGRTDVQKQRQEDILIQVLPVLNEALALRNVPEVVLGCFMIITVLVHKIDLDDGVIDTLMVAITQSLSVDIIDDALACLAILAERRQALKLPKTASKTILNVDRLTSRLERLRLNQPLGRLASGLALEVLERTATGKTSSPSALFEQLIDGDYIISQDLGLLQQRLSTLLANDSVDAVNRSALLALSDIASRASFDRAPDVFRADEQDTIMGGVDSTTQPQPASNDDHESERGLFDQRFTNSALESFLHAHATSEFEELNAVYSKCLSSFEENPINFAPRSKQAVLLCSFLMRAWTSGKAVASRQSALRMMSHHLTKMGSDFEELQAIVPYILVALSDRATAVRRAAATLLIAYSQLPQRQPQETKKNGASKKQSTLTQIYGTQITVEVLGAKDIAGFLHSGLLSDVEEFVVDSQRIAQTLHQSLDSSAKPQAGREANKFKTSQKEAVCSFLSTHVRNTPLHNVKLGLLTMLNNIDKIGSHRRSTYLLPALQDWISTVDSEESRLAVSGSQEIRTQFLASVHPGDAEAVTFLVGLALGETTSNRLGVQGAAFERLRHIWSSLKDTRQRKIAESLTRVALSGKTDPLSGTIRGEASGFLRGIRVPGEVFVLIMEEALDEMEPAGRPSSAKKRRVDDNASTVSKATDTGDVKDALAKLTFILEIVDTSLINAQPELVNSLFKLLRSIQALRRSSSVDLSYLQSMALGNLNAIMEQADASKLIEFDSTIAYADLLVDTVRNTTNTEVRNSALLLLSSLAKAAPQVILHSVMPIFTLMSTSTMRQSDDFSAHIVDQTIQRIIPLLAESLKKQKKDLISAVAEVLLSFASAYDHIPHHRRLHLFSLLASSLGAEDSLFAVIVALVDRFPGNSGVYRFATQLLRQFSATEALMTVHHYTQFITQCFDRNSSAWKVLLKGNSGEDYQKQVLQELLTVLPSLLADESLQSKVKADMRSSSETSETLKAIFGNILQESITVLRTLDQNKLDRSSCARAVTQLLNLLPFDQLIEAVEPLLDNEDQELRRSIIKALEGCIRSSPKANSSSRKATIAFLPRLTSILESSAAVGLKHSAVACIDRISEKFGKTDPDAVAQATQVIASVHCIGSSDKLLRILSLHCLGSAVEILGNDFIPLMQQSSEAAFACLDASLKQGQGDPKLHNAAYAFFIATMDQIPFVFSQASLKRLIEFSHVSATFNLGSEADGNRNHMYQIAATRMDFKSVINVVTSEWSSAMKHGVRALHEHISFLRMAVDNHPKSLVSSNFRALSEFFLLAGNLRQSVAEDNGILRLHNNVEGSEGKILEILMATVLKVNDAVFRPFFLRFSQWSAPSSISPQSSETSVQRSITFFKFLTLLSERLKSIVTSYFGYIVDRAAEILTATYAKGDLGQTLQASVLTAITSSFKYDQDDFWQSPSHFNAILPAMVEHLSGSTASPARTTTVIDSLIELAGAATASPDNLKALSAALLRLARSDVTRVRLAAVKCEQALTQRVGDDWLGLLPEMLPVINELQDDDDETVEKETHKWIKMIETTLGESLDSMLQ